MLPLVLEPTAYYLVMAGPLGLPLLGMAGYVIWKEWGRSEFGIDPRSYFPLTMLIAIGGGILVQPIGWRFICDRDGMALHAPLDMFATHETIKWKDLKEVRFGSTWGRSARPTVEFVGKDEAVIEITVLNGVPDSYWPVLFAVIAEKAPGIWRDPAKEKDEWVADARRAAGPQPVMFGWRYRARDGAGHVYSVPAPPLHPNYHPERK